jgi:hypothetical protein
MTADPKKHERTYVPGLDVFSDTRGREGAVRALTSREKLDGGRKSATE